MANSPTLTVATASHAIGYMARIREQPRSVARRKTYESKRGRKAEARKLRVSRKRLSCVSLGALALGFAAAHPAAARADSPNNGLVERVLLISIDGCTHLILRTAPTVSPASMRANPSARISPGSVTWYNLHSDLDLASVRFVPWSDSPGDRRLTALDGCVLRCKLRSLLIAAREEDALRDCWRPRIVPKCHRTQVGFDEEIDIELTKLDAGGGINPDYLPRDPKNSCAPVYPHQFIRVNRPFEVVKAAGGYTAWSDKHQSYQLVDGRSGKGVDDSASP